MLNIVNKSKHTIDVDMLNNVYVNILNKEEKEEKDVDVLFLDEGEIRQFNSKYRGKDSETDVISFTNELDFIPVYGEIIIDISVANKQKGNKTLETEIKELFIHGMLHLLGYDHLSAEGKNIMSKKELIYRNLN